VLGRWRAPSATQAAATAREEQQERLQLLQEKAVSVWYYDEPTRATSMIEYVCSMYNPVSHELQLEALGEADVYIRVGSARWGADAIGSDDDVGCRNEVSAVTCMQTNRHCMPIVGLRALVRVRLRPVPPPRLELSWVSRSPSLQPHPFATCATALPCMYACRSCQRSTVRQVTGSEPSAKKKVN
jgi:hypothetical protein